MQYAVPQFTDVEDKLVAGLGFKQFGILFAVGVLVFLTWNLSHSVLILVTVTIFVGGPALAIVFIKINGRPLYNSLFAYTGSTFEPKHFIFHKQGKTANENKEEATITEVAPTAALGSALVRIKQLNYLLQQQASEEQLLIQHIADGNKTKTTP
jgi:hypothetical protein